MTRSPKVLLIEKMYHPDGQRLLEESMELMLIEGASDAQISEVIGDAFAVAVRYPGKLTAKAIHQATRLAVISTSGRGTDGIDMAAATEVGIAVVNNPGLGTIPVSEHTIGLMLDLAKQITLSDRNLRTGRGWSSRLEMPCVELAGLTLGIVGMGNIGTEVARKCTIAFSMRTLVFDPYIPDGKAESIGAERVRDLQSLLEQADIVSLHPELNDETRGMIGELELRSMKRHSFLINTSRGAVVRQDALVRALSEGWIRAAALDVFDPEPPDPSSSIFSLENLIVTPHLAGLTDRARRDLAISAARQILSVLKGERPEHMVNPSVWDTASKRITMAGLSSREKLS
jgi:D-3-phosphoglycerate dehydrogenase